MPDFLSPRQFAEALGVSESSVRRWSDAGRIKITRTEGGHRRISRTEAVRFVRENDTALMHPELLGFHEPEHRRQRTEAFAAQHDQLLQALEEGRGEVAAALLKRMYVNGVGVAEICDGPLRHAMHCIGEIWPEKKAGILVEHRATTICIDSLVRLRDEFNPPREKAPTVIGGAPEHDPYILPSLAASTVLAELGFNVVNLGPNTPLEVLVTAAVDFNAKAVWVALTADLPRPQVNRDLERAANRLGRKKIQMFMGGRSSRRYRIPSTPHVHSLGSMTEMAGIAKTLI